MTNRNFNLITDPTIELRFVLRKLIKMRGITITSLSRTTQVPLQTLHGWLQGSEPKSLKQIKKVADYFEVSLDYLCFETKKIDSSFCNFEDEINTGIFEVILRKKQ